MRERFDGVPDWSFSLTEKSAGMYLLEASDKVGRRFEMRGSNETEMIKRARETAIAMSKEPLRVPTWWECLKRALRKEIF